MPNWTLVHNQRFNSPEECLVFFELYRRNLNHKNAIPELIQTVNGSFGFPSGIGVYSEMISSTQKCKKKNSPLIKSNPYSGYWSIIHTTHNKHTLLSVRIYRNFATLQIFRNFPQIALDYGGETYPQKPEALSYTLEEFNSLKLVSV